MYKIPGYSDRDRVLPGLLAETVMNFIPFTLKRPALVMLKRFVSTQTLWTIDACFM